MSRRSAVHHASQQARERRAFHRNAEAKMQGAAGTSVPGCTTVNRSLRARVGLEIAGIHVREGKYASGEGGSQSVKEKTKHRSLDNLGHGRMLRNGSLIQGLVAFDRP